VSTKILVVDDKANMRTVLHDYLVQQGYQVTTADNGRNALYAARHQQPDLILLDIMMPEMDGYEFLSAHRRERKTPVIIITAKQEESDAVIGLELGADDFVLKPFRLRELVARIHAVLRRCSAAQTIERLSVGDLVLDHTTHAVSLNAVSVELTPTEFNLLAIFMGAPGRAFTREELFNKLVESGSGFDGLEKTLNVHIRNLRTKIEPNPAEPTYIETVFGVGYRLRNL
jgi:DNA-binding response OmpR family regulator